MPEMNINSRATFIVDTTGRVRFAEKYGKGELPDPDKILAEVKKL
jgi:peroxiredoxin